MEGLGLETNVKLINAFHLKVLVKSVLHDEQSSHLIEESNNGKSGKIKNMGKRNILEALFEAN